MQKIRKILRVSKKTALPTNQPTNDYQQHRSYRTYLDAGLKTYPEKKITFTVLLI